MKKKSKLLSVMSIIFIVFGAIGILSGCYSIFSYNTITSTLESMGMSDYTLPIGYYTLSLVGSCLEVAAGIIGVMYKSRKSVLIIGALYCLYIIADLIASAVLVGFSATFVFSLILPVLYMWGWYQSE